MCAKLVGDLEAQIVEQRSEPVETGLRLADLEEGGVPRSEPALHPKEPDDVLSTEGVDLHEGSEVVPVDAHLNVDIRRKGLGSEHGARAVGAHGPRQREGADEAKGQGVSIHWGIGGYAVCTAISRVR